MSIAVPGVSAASLEALLHKATSTQTEAAHGGLSLQEPAEGTGVGGAGETSAAQASEALGGNAAEALGGAEGGGFGGALTEAISSLEKTQQSASGAAQELALGTVKDPESAVMTVEDAQLAMDLAAQIRTKATEAVQTIFQTQV